MFALISNNTVIKYPVEPALDFPHISFPRDWEGGQIEDKLYSKVVSGIIPNPSLGYRPIEVTPYFNSNTNITTQQWSTEVLPVEDLKLAISDYRFYVETGGMSLNGNFFATDRDSQMKYTSLASFLNLPTVNNETFTVNWKFSNGTFGVLDSNTILEVATYALGHVQAAYNQEAYYLNLINTANSTVLQTTDFTQGWPSNS